MRQGSLQVARRRGRRSARGRRFLPLLRDASARGHGDDHAARARPASATRCGWRGAASGRRSRRGTSRWRSSSGRCAAALVTGNTVVAKPAPQTPRHRRARGRTGARGRRAGRCADPRARRAGGRRRAGRRHARRRRRLHRLDRDRQEDRPRAARRRCPPDRAADRGDRRDQRDDRRIRPRCPNRSSPTC